MTIFFMYLMLLMVMVGFQECVSTQSEMVAPPEVTQHNDTLYAACRMRPSTTLAEDLPKVYGHVLFKQEYPQGILKVLLHLKGFPRGRIPKPRSVHIHQYGDISQGCDSTGGHYNPLNVHHPNHPGDFGNFANPHGRINVVIDSNATLFGELSLMGRAVIVHEKMDDLGRGGDAGSLLYGNAGRRLGCCVIGISSPKLWNMYYNA
ncbi:extracellular superoxide dismutase [Cu-Zn]-like [Lampris incognitus]|uniref:extracellular superoxide dismutase [Cu-Zn]-like n=1 Tax=Lampris incognitus TaxID=2546036 RepID=UPI0024B52DEA|nr:extracellular superoxide dismutase [Cu-Zn]-like [Lampris incognitus]